MESTEKKSSVDELAGAVSKLVIEETKREIDQIKKPSKTKTPIAILQELLGRRGIVASYELVQTETAIHETIFRYRVTFKTVSNTFMAMGNGRTKKEAKHDAARALLEKLKYVKLPAPRGCFKSSNNSSDEDGGGKRVPPAVERNPSLELPSDDDASNVSGNPVGWIQELCMQKNWQPPEYTTVSEDGLAHERIYTISCVLLDFREIGKGRSKKIAKRLAANNMKTCLLKNDYDKNKRSPSSFPMTMKDTKDGPSSSRKPAQPRGLENSLKNYTGKKLLKLQKICLMTPDLDYKKMLSEIAEENKFDVSYVDVEERAFSGNYQCMVHMSTVPVGVCPGSGESQEEAQNAAAQSALEFLKIMTKK